MKIIFVVGNRKWKQGRIELFTEGGGGVNCEGFEGPAPGEFFDFQGLSHAI